MTNDRRMTVLMRRILPFLAAGHLADSLANDRTWSLLGVRRLMTLIGLMGPGLFLLAFVQVSNLHFAVV